MPPIHAIGDGLAIAAADWGIVSSGFSFGIPTAAVVVAYFWAISGQVAKQLDEQVASGEAQGLAPAAKWKIGDSWASNISGLAAAAGAVVAATQDQLGEAVVKEVGVAFAVGGALVLAIAAVSPVVYATWQRYYSRSEIVDREGQNEGSDDPTAAEGTHERAHASHMLPAEHSWFSLPTHMKAARKQMTSVASDDGFPTQPGDLVGTYPGLLLASFVTLVATFTSLGMVAESFNRGIVGAPEWLGPLAWVVIVATSVVVAAYAVRTLYWLLLDALKKPGTGSVVPGAVDVDCCGGSDGMGAGRRTSML